MIGIKFGTKHSYDDFGLILSSKSLPFPSPKTSKVDIKGADGSIDLSTVLTDGNVKYENRKLTFVFTAIGSWQTLTDTFAAYVHGQRMDIILDADTEHYFTGRVDVSSVKEKNPAVAEITVTVDAEPWRYDVNLTTVPSVVETTETLIITNTRRWVVPTITVSAPIQLTYEGVVYALQTGTSIIPAVILKEGNNALTFTGAANVSVAFRKAVL